MKNVAANRIGAKNLPQIAGVYQFMDSDGIVLYVGKAKNLNARVRSYFQSKLEIKTAQMVKKAVKICYIPVPSEFEALLLEARLVKKCKPRYNIELRDDKSPLYIGITKEEFPRVLLLRQRELPFVELANTYGPFVSGRVTRQILRRIRRIFPYSTHKPGKRACVYKEIGLCDPCPSEISMMSSEVKLRETKIYKTNIAKIRKVLSGKISYVVQLIEKEMKEYAEGEMYEAAMERRQQIAQLKHLTEESEPTSEFIKNPNLMEDITDHEQEDLRTVLSPYILLDKLIRIECFDVAHLSGTHPTASMVTFVNGIPEKTLYRHFRVSTKRKNNDVDSLRQVLSRRVHYLDQWGEPDLMIIDGGKGQVGAARDVVPLHIQVVGLEKRFEHLV